MKHFFRGASRQTDKPTLLKAQFPKAFRIDLLQSDIFTRYVTEPWLLREALRANPQAFVVIDEVQKFPQLLEEAHWLIEMTHLGMPQKL